jgi:surface antigen
MRPNPWIASAAAAALLVGGCAGTPPPTREEGGAVIGAVAGGVLGGQVGHGAGQAAAIFVGAILGAIAGREIGRGLDIQDEMRAQQVLEKNRTGQMTSWVDPDSGGTVSVMPTRTYQKADKTYCREYTTEVIVGGKREQAYGTACRQPDGSWKIVQ